MVDGDKLTNIFAVYCKIDNTHEKPALARQTAVGSFDALSWAHYNNILDHIHNMINYDLH